MSSLGLQALPRLCRASHRSISTPTGLSLDLRATRPLSTSSPSSFPRSTSLVSSHAQQRRLTPSSTSPPYLTARGQSLLLPFHARSFQTSPASSIRESYYLRPTRGSSSGGGYGGGRGGGQSWWKQLRGRIDAIPGNYLIYGMIGVNVGIYFTWEYANTSWRRFRDPTLYYWLSRNFVVSEANLAAGRVYTLITSCFSHSTSSHILMNMLGLYFIAPATVGLLGNTAFLGVYFAGGVIGSAVSLAWHRLREGGRGQGRKVGHEGASAAIYSSLAFYATMFPQSKILLFLIIPMPAWVAVGGLFAYDLFSTIQSPYSMTDSAGHVGGMLAGVGLALASRGRTRGPRVPWR